MKYHNFHEYMDAKGKLKEPIKNDTSGDHVEQGKGKGEGTDGSKAPKGKKTVGKDWASLGEKDLVVKFDKDGNTSGGKKAAKIPTAEFAKYELLPLIRETIETDPLMVEEVVRELKRNGLLGLLVGELLEHKETYRQLAAVMGHDEYGPMVCNRLARAMREEAAVPFRDTLDDEESEDDEETDVPNRDTSDGEGIEDDEEKTDEEAPEETAPEQVPQSAQANVPPGPMNPMPTAGGPAMRNFQRAMMGRW